MYMTEGAGGAIQKEPKKDEQYLTPPVMENLLRP